MSGTGRGFQLYVGSTHSAFDQSRMSPLNPLNYRSILGGDVFCLSSRSYNRPDHNDKRFLHVYCQRSPAPPSTTKALLLTAANFLASRAPLRTGHAVAALLVLEDGRYIMQLRDDVPNIWYPGHWGLFGGGVDDREDEVAALRRELREELELEVNDARLFAIINYDLQPIGLDCYFRRYYEVPVTIAAWNRVVLHEGSDVRALTGDEALSLPRIS